MVVFSFFFKFSRFIKDFANDKTKSLQHTNDQGLLRRFFPMSRRWDLNSFSDVFFHYADFQAMFSKYHSSLLPKMFEWEPYLGVNDEAVIIHFHGPKFNVESCYTNYSQSIDATKWSNDLKIVAHHDALVHNMEGYHFYVRTILFGHLRTVCTGRFNHNSSAEFRSS